ncbi:ABC transporter permease [Sagittula sp. SSi028]|uniref:ABC transporter permease n=1 Tax=Sagittula sp. SSi028 TaxID=3400636 RepID=UPI003AF83623
MDRTVIVSLQAMEVIHVDWQSGAKGPNTTPVKVIRQMDLQPQAITAALVGVESRLQIFGLQRAINDCSEELLLAILPRVALAQLWQIVGVAETALVGVSFMVVVTALMGMLAMIFASLNERRREMAIGRAMGASPITILGLLACEAVLVAAIGAVVGVVLLYGALALARPAIDAHFGIWLPINPPAGPEALALAGVILAAAIASLLPALGGRLHPRAAPACQPACSGHD